MTQLVHRETKIKNFRYYLIKVLKPILSLPPFYRIVNVVTILQINKNIWSPKKNVLCVGDPDDRMKFLEMESENFNINIIWFPRRVVDWLFYKYIKVYKVIGLGEWSLDDYYNNEFVNQNNRATLRSKYSRLLKDINKILNIECLILPKLNDDWIVDFQLSAKNVGVPIVVTDRESAITKKRMEIYPPLLKKHSADLNVAEYICVNNEMHREFFLKSGIDKERIKLTGSPQSDVWTVKSHSRPLENLIQRLDKNKKIILFLGFGVRGSLNFYYPDEDRNWDTLCKDVHDELANFIIKNKNEITILYKIGSKPARDYWHGYDDFYQKLKDNEVENSLIQVRDKIITPELLPHVDLTVSFQTSGIVEAMFHIAPIIYVGWGELYEDIKNTLHDFENSGVLYASSKENLKKLLSMYTENNLPAMKTEKFSKWKYDFFYKADGKSSHKILKLVSEVISNK